MSAPIDVRNIDLTNEEFLRLQVQDAVNFDDPAVEYLVHTQLSIDGGASFLMDLTTTLQGTARAKDDSLPFIEYPPGMEVWNAEAGEAGYRKFDFAHVEIFSNQPTVAAAGVF